MVINTEIMLGDHSSFNIFMRFKMESGILKFL